MEGKGGRAFSKEFESELNQAHLGSKAARERLLVPLEPMLRRWAGRKCGKRFSAEDLTDIVQSVFLRAWKEFDQFAGTTVNELSSWIRVILDNEINMIFRSRQREEKILACEVPFDKAVAVGQSPVTGHPIHDAIKKEHQEIFQNALSHLPERPAALIVWRYVNRQTYQKIADQLGCSPEAARKLCQRAKDKLQRAVTKVPESPHPRQGKPFSMDKGSPDRAVARLPRH